MGIEFIALLCFGAMIGGFIGGLAGFGAGLLSLGVWLHILPAWQAVALVSAASIGSGLYSVWVIRIDVQKSWRSLPEFIAPALIGVPLGLLSLPWIPVEALKWCIAVLMLTYSVFFMFKPKRKTDSEPPHVVNVAVGFIGGFLGGAAALSGVIPTMWCAMQTWGKGHISAILRPYNMSILALAVPLYAWQGFYSWDTLKLLALIMPINMLFAQIGLHVYRRLNDAQFKQLLYVLLLGGGLALLVGAAA